MLSWYSVKHPKSRAFKSCPVEKGDIVFAVVYNALIFLLCLFHFGNLKWFLISIVVTLFLFFLEWAAPK